MSKGSTVSISTPISRGCRPVPGSRPSSKGHRGARVASTTLMAPMSRAFVGESERFARREEMEVVRFTKGQRKETVTKDRLKRFTEPEGLLYLGIAQERCS